MQNVSAKKLHHRLPTGFQIRIWLEPLWCGVGGGLKCMVFGIRSRRLVYKEVIEVWSNYKKSYFWWCWLLRLNPGARGKHLTSYLLWTTAGLLVLRFIVLSTQWMKEMRTWDRSEITFFFRLAWIKFIGSS